MNLLKCTVVLNRTTVYDVSLLKESESWTVIRGFLNRVKVRMIISQNDFRQSQLHTRTVVVQQDRYYSSYYDYAILSPLALGLNPKWLQYVINLSPVFMVYRLSFDVLLPTITHRCNFTQGPSPSSQQPSPLDLIIHILVSLWAIFIGCSVIGWDPNQTLFKF